MATKEMMQPVRIPELRGYSTENKKGSEKKMMQPMKIKDMIESCSKSCSRATDRSTKPKFLLPDNNVRRKLYGRTPSPQKYRESYFPGQTFKTRPSMFSSQLIAKSSSRPSNSLKVTENLSAKKILPQQSQSEKTKVANTNLRRKSFLPRPNSIVNRHIENQNNEKSAMEMSTLMEDSEISEGSIHEKTIEILKTPSRVQGSEKVDEKIPENEACLEEYKSRPTVIKCIDSERLRKLDKDIEEMRRDVEEIKSHQKAQDHLLEKIYELLCRKLDVNIDDEKKSVEAVSSTPKMEEVANLPKTTSCEEILKEDDSALATSGGKNKENLMSGKKRRKSNIAMAERRRSLRLADKNASLNNDSFAKLEEQLAIKNSNKENPQNDQENLNCRTPMVEKIKRLSKSDKPLREYLAMKASMNFLETPDVNRFKKCIEPVDDTPLRRKSLRRSISSKLFNELQDLYHDSPVSDSIRLT